MNTQEFSEEIRMIEPKTEAGKQLKSGYDSKIQSLMNDNASSYPRSGHGSKHDLKNRICREYNHFLSNIEDVTEEEMSEASRPQMKTPQTAGGNQLKSRFDERIYLALNSNIDETDIYNMVNDLRVEYNRLLAEIEG